MRPAPPPPLPIPLDPAGDEIVPGRPPRPAGEQDSYTSPALWNLIQRTSFGHSAFEVSLANAIGYSAYLERQLAPTYFLDTDLDEWLATSCPTLTMAPYQLSGIGEETTIQQLISARLMRASFSRKQLFERLVEMWTDHFNIWIRAGICTHLKTIDDREVVRAHAMGTFPDLLRASAHSPAMLVYLTNTTNYVGAPNENYARELMELHTLGIGNYTQQDVREVARCFTGWGAHDWNAGAQSQTFRFEPSIHDNGPKTVLGHHIPAGGGQQDGETVLSILVEHPATSRTIARRLLTEFWGYTPPDSLVEPLAYLYRVSGGNIPHMVRFILAETLSPPPTPKLKRPMHLMVSAIRATRASMNGGVGMFGILESAGNLPFNWPPPDGYPDSLEAWSSLLLPRWNFAASMLNGDFSFGPHADIRAWTSGSTRPTELAERINRSIFGGFMPPAERQAIIAHLLPDPPSTQRITEAMSLALASPSFQWY